MTKCSTLSTMKEIASASRRSYDRQARSRERLLAQPVLPLLMARGGVLDAHLGDCFIWDKLTNAFTPASRATAAMVTVASRYPADGDMLK